MTLHQSWGLFLCWPDYCHTCSQSGKMKEIKGSSKVRCHAKIKLKFGANDNKGDWDLLVWKRLHSHVWSRDEPQWKVISINRENIEQLGTFLGVAAKKNHNNMYINITWCLKRACCHHIQVASFPKLLVLSHIHLAQSPQKAFIQADSRWMLDTCHRPLANCCALWRQT